MEPLSENSREALKETVFQLITHNQQFEALTKEITEKNEKSSKDLRPVSELCYLSMMRNQSLMLGTSIGHYGSDQCASVLSSIVKSSKGPLLSDTEKAEVASVILALQALMAEECLEKSRFHATLMQHSHLPLELLWILAKEGILNIEAYVSKKCSSAGFLSDFHSQMKLLSLDTDSTNVAVQCLAGILTELIDLVFSDRKVKTIGTDVLSSLTSILDRAVLGIVDLVLNSQNKEINFIKAFAKIEVSVVTLKKASSHFLSLVLSYKPVTKVSQAIQQQDNWCYGKASPLLLDWYKLVLLPFTIQEILEKLQRILEQQEINWQLLLTFVSTTIVCLPEAQKLFLDFVDNLFHEGLENCDMESLITGLLLARQACFHGPHVFMSYNDWFQRTFSDSSRSLANTRKSFTFFLKFLTNIVPYEDASHLKVHILRPPFVPPKCREQLADYVLLAKTRLEDLKDTIEIPGQEDLKSADESKQLEQLQAEVENAVHVYDMNGKIPSSVMEASIFKKPYYVGRFLPALLKPRPLPSVPDAKMKLVEALKKAEKIPPSMYINYEKSCKKETLQLTEGLFLDLDSDDDMELSPMEQLDSSLNQFHQAVQHLCGVMKEAPKLNVSEGVSMICEKIGAVMNTSSGNQETKETYIILDTDNLGLSQQQLQVIDALLNNICRSVYSSYSSPSPDFSWLSLLMKGITQYPIVIRNLFMRIWALIFTQEENLENHHINSLATILVELQRLGDCVPLIQLSGRWSQGPVVARSFTEHVYELISVSDGKAMAFTLRLTVSYMKYMISSEELKIPHKCTVLPIVVKKLVYTATRLLREVRFKDMNSEEEIKTTDHFVISLYRSPVFQGLLQDIKFTFSDWLKYEIMVNTDKDIFTFMEWYEYYSWAVYQHFLPMSVEEGGFSGDFKLAASQVLQVLLNSDHRCHDRQLSCNRCNYKVLDGSTSRNHMVSLLQELTRMFRETDASHDVGLPWLPRQLVTLCENISSEIQLQAVVTSFFRIALCLPSHLLFCDYSPTQEPVKIDEIAEFFNKYLVEYLTEGLYLPLSLTLYIIQGLRLACTKGNFIENLDSLYEKCPLVSLSIMVHHKHVEYLIHQQHDRGKTAAVKTIIDHFRHKTGSTSDIQSYNWLVAAMLFSVSLNCCFSFDVLTGNLPAASGNLDKVFAVFAELLVLHWTSLQMSEFHQVSSDRLPTLIGKILQSKSGAAVMSALLNRKADSLPSQCARKSTLQFRHVAVMRLLISVPLKSFVKLFSGYLGDLLSLFAEVGETFEQLCPENSETKEIQQVVTLDELMVFNRFLKNVIAVTPASTLRNIPQDVFLKCGTDVVLLVQGCLSRS